MSAARRSWSLIAACEEGDTTQMDRRAVTVTLLLLCASFATTSGETPTAANVRDFLEAEQLALLSIDREEWEVRQSPAFRAAEIARTRLLLGHARAGNVLASAAVWLVAGRRAESGLSVAEFLQSAHPPRRRYTDWSLRLALPRVEELVVSDGAMEAVIRTSHARTRIWASWSGTRFLVDDAVHGARPRRAASPAERVFDRWRIALSMRDGRTLFECLSDRKQALLRKKHGKGLLGSTFLRFGVGDLLSSEALRTELEQATADPVIANLILRGPWKLGYSSPVRYIYVAPGLPPVEILLEGKRWYVSTALNEFLPPAPAK